MEWRLNVICLSRLFTLCDLSSCCPDWTLDGKLVVLRVSPCTCELSWYCRRDDSEIPVDPGFVPYDSAIHLKLKSPLCKTCLAWMIHANLPRYGCQHPRILHLIRPSLQRRFQSLRLKNSYGSPLFLLAPAPELLCQSNHPSWFQSQFHLDHSHRRTGKRSNSSFPDAAVAALIGNHANCCQFAQD